MQNWLFPIAHSFDPCNILWTSSPPPTADGIAVLPGALVLSLGYILQRGTQGMPEVERMRMLYNMVDKVRADLLELTIEDIWPRH